MCVPSIVHIQGTHTDWHS